MFGCELDHIVVGAASLEEGVRFLHERLGVTIPPGGKHTRMGTHNCVMRLGGNSFLELIAVDPDAPCPSHPRWYALDDPAMHARLAESPHVIGWVVRTVDIVARVQAAAVWLGAVLRISRDALSWLLTVPEDGHLPGGGVIPHLIEWDSGARPWEGMPDLGCRLAELILTHPDPVWLKDALLSLDAAFLPHLSIREGKAPTLAARIVAPEGAVVAI